MTRADIRVLQRELNHFTKTYLRGVAALRVDGAIGHATQHRIKRVKHYLGYQHGKKSPLTATPNPAFRNRLRHPKNPRWSSPARIARGMRRRSEQRRAWQHNDRKATAAVGVTHYDGIPVAACAVPILNWCRAHGWRGRLVSGWRDPVYSQHLCLAMCGRPSCPGLCAGLASNHVGSTPARFALDVSDYVTFRAVVARCPLSPHVHNALPRDLVHFSPSGG